MHFSTRESRLMAVAMLTFSMSGIDGFVIALRDLFVDFDHE